MEGCDDPLAVNDLRPSNMARLARPSGLKRRRKGSGAASRRCARQAAGSADLLGVVLSRWPGQHCRRGQVPGRFRLGGVAFTVAGVVAFPRYSLGRFLRVRLLRLLYGARTAFEERQDIN